MRNLILAILSIVLIGASAYNIIFTRTEPKRAEPEAPAEAPLPPETNPQGAEEEPKRKSTAAEKLDSLKLKNIKFKTGKFYSAIRGLEYATRYADPTGEGVKFEMNAGNDDTQRVSYERAEGTLREILDEMSKQYGYAYEVKHGKIFIEKISVPDAPASARKGETQSAAETEIPRATLRPAAEKQQDRRNPEAGRRPAAAPAANPPAEAAAKAPATRRQAAENGDEKESIISALKEFSKVGEEEMREIENFYAPKRSQPRPISRKYMISIDISQKVNRLYSGERGENDGTNVRKKINVEIKSFVDIELIICYYCNVASEYKSEDFLRKKFLVERASREKKVVFSYEDITPSYRNYEYLNYNHKYGNAKMQSAVFVFEKKTGELIGKRGTKDNFLKYIEEKRRREMNDFVERARNMPDSAIPYVEMSGASAQNAGATGAFGGPHFGGKYIDFINFPVKSRGVKPSIIKNSPFFNSRGEWCFLFCFAVYEGENNKLEFEKTAELVDLQKNPSLPINPNKKIKDAAVLVYSAQQTRTGNATDCKIGELLEKQTQNAETHFLNFILEKYSDFITGM